ncbi:copper resistance D family protein [Rugamonas sp. CCM 8940]|uniref:copper resistance D family protein n=2 Tax=Rugamonas sp. CCM 8940 TaxID=2765359 RepID=UPI00360FE3A8
MDPVALLQLGSALLLNLGFAWLVGSAFVRWCRGPDLADLALLRRLDMAAATLGLCASVAALWASTAVMSGLPLDEASGMFWTMLTTTDHGHAGCVTIVVMAVLLVLRGMGGAGLLGEAAVVLSLAVFAYTRATMGHAGEAGFWSLPLAAESLHLAAIALWTGVVLLSACFVFNGARLAGAAADGGRTARYLERMSQAAVLALVVIAATGVYSGWHRVGTGGNLLHTAYGLTLLAKLGLVGLAVALGGYNKLVGLPAAARSERGLRLVRTVLRMEALLLLAVLLAAALLTSQQPPTAL